MFLHQMGVTMGTYQRFPAHNEWSHFEWEDAVLSEPLCEAIARSESGGDPHGLIDSYVRIRARRAAGKPWGVKTPFLLPFLDSLRTACSGAGEKLTIVLTERDYKETVGSLRRQSSHLSEFDRGSVFPKMLKIQDVLAEHWTGASEDAEVFHLKDTLEYPRMAAKRLANLAGIEADLDKAIRGFRGRGL